MVISVVRGVEVYAGAFSRHSRSSRDMKMIESVFGSSLSLSLYPYYSTHSIPFPYPFQYSHSNLTIPKLPQHQVLNKHLSQHSYLLPNETYSRISRLMRDLGDRRGIVGLGSWLWWGEGRVLWRGRLGFGGIGRRCRVCFCCLLLLLLLLLVDSSCRLLHRNLNSHLRVNHLISSQAPRQGHSILRCDSAVILTLPLQT